MRWRFCDRPLEAEVRARSATLAAIDRWWAAFVASADAIDATFAGPGEVDVPAFMAQHLSPIDPRLMWEYGPGLRNGGHRLVITPESEGQLRPLVEVILARAPSLPRWEFYPGRLAETLSQSLASVLSRTEVDLSQFEARVAPAEAHNRFDLTWFHPQGVTVTDATREAAFLASEMLLGEEFFDTWIAAVEVAARPGAGFFSRLLGRATPASTGDQSLGSLKSRTEALVDGLIRSLPQVPLASEEDDKGYVFERKPPNQEDYSGQDDLFVGVTRGSQELWHACHAPGFSSKRFSRLGETFCYLKIDGSNGLAGSEFDDRGGIQDALDEALGPGLGSVTGGGTGRRYSYVDLAVRDVDSALATVRARLQAGRLPKRSWVLFHDAHWQDEWVGVFDDTPAPFSDAGPGDSSSGGT